MGLYAFSALEISSHDFLCHPRVDIKAVGQEVGQFDRVILPLCAIPADGFISPSEGSTVPVIESINETFLPRSLPEACLFKFLICVLDSLLNLFFFKKSKPNCACPQTKAVFPLHGTA